ncbi:MAG: tRNA lysidine(34) synthetase TilS [Pirellulaceae bacterium]|nr:tRNA lysidine(34) synthetase TilS [Pirellulaceae bacterium]
MPLESELKASIVTTDSNELQLELPVDFWNAPKVLVAVSGGSDSFSLIHALQNQRRKLAQSRPIPEVIAFHFDHRWQDRSTELARWVETRLKACGIATVLRQREDDEAVQSRKPAEASNRVGPQSEGKARAQRYAALAEVAESQGATYALTGHTRDDQAETVLMRIARGTGLAGLTGIPQQRQLSEHCQLLRPLLHESRQRLRDYLQGIGQEYWDDPTNADPHWTRNRVRQSVLPWLRQNLSPQIDASLVRLAQLASEHREVVQCLAEVHRGAVLECGDKHLVINVRLWAQLSESVVRTLLVYWWGQARFPLQEMNFEHWRRLATLICRPVEDGLQPRWPSELHFPGPIVAKRSAGVLRIVTQLK